MKRIKIYLIVSLAACFIFLSFRRSINPTDRLNEIAIEYKQYQQFKRLTPIGDTVQYKWTIALCVRLGRYKKDSSFISNADKSLSPHGNKLYRLFIKNYFAYVRNAPEGQPRGQVVVKETWNVKEVSYDSLDTAMEQIQSRNDGKWYTPTTVSELFIMYKEKEKSYNDEGWNYGTVSLEDKNEKPSLLNDIKLSSCIGCHKETKYDRIFGVER